MTGTKECTTTVFFFRQKKEIRQTLSSQSKIKNNHMNPKLVKMKTWKDYSYAGK